MNEEKIYPTMVIRSQAEAIELLEKENKQLQNNWNELKEILDNTLYKLNGYLDRNLSEEQMLVDFIYIRNKMQEMENK